jgi:hypothetical protein
MSSKSEDGTVDQSYVEIVVEALQGLLARDEPDPEMGMLSHHDFVDLFNYLHRAGLANDRLAHLEWAYLPVFGYDARPVALGRLMADEPDFFADAVALVYRPTKEGDDEEEGEDQEGDAETTEPEAAAQHDDEQQRQARASNAYRLLSEWRTVPGVNEQGELDGAALTSWVHRARERLLEIGRRDAGDSQIGKMLAWTPPGADGEWPSEPVRDLVESLQSERVERGIETELYNSRGVSTRSPFAGGGQERKLAEGYRDQAAQFQDRWPRSAAVLRKLAHSLESDARRWDDDAERTHRGFR